MKIWFHKAPQRPGDPMNRILIKNIISIKGILDIRLVFNPDSYLIAKEILQPDPGYCNDEFLYIDIESEYEEGARDSGFEGFIILGPRYSPFEIYND